MILCGHVRHLKTGWSALVGSHSCAELLAQGWGTVVLWICLAASPGAAAALQAPAQGSPVAKAPAEVLDRVVAVVDNHAILSSDVNEEIRLSILDPSQGAAESLTPARALDELISRTLIQQQMRREDVQAAAPTQDELDARLIELRRDLPACGSRKCASDSDWKAFLTAHTLTPERVASYLSNRMEILRFIEQRFRQGIRATPAEVETYYRTTLLPQYAAGAEVPALETVAPRIEEVLLQQRVTALFDDWLTNLRRQGEVEVLDPALETPRAEAGPGDGSQ
jgi:peptidyl-prolyl cis-trans isomerase SurA